MEEVRASSAKKWRFRIAAAIMFLSPIAATATGALWIWAVDSGHVATGPFSANAPYRVAQVLGGLGAMAGVMVLPIRPYHRGLLALVALPLGFLATALAELWAIFVFIALQSD